MGAGHPEAQAAGRERSGGETKRGRATFPAVLTPAHLRGSSRATGRRELVPPLAWIERPDCDIGLAGCETEFLSPLG